MEETNECSEKEKYTNYQIVMSNIQLSNETLTLAEVYKIVKIFGTSMEISNLSAIGNTLVYLGHENTSVIIITTMPIILHPTMFVHEVIQYKETFQRIKWRLKLTSGATWHDIEVRSEAVEVIERQELYQIYVNMTGVKLITRCTLPRLQLDPNAPRLVTICEDIIVHAIRSNTFVINMTSTVCNDGVHLPVSENSFIRAIITNICFFSHGVTISNDCCLQEDWYDIYYTWVKPRKHFDLPFTV